MGKYIKTKGMDFHKRAVFYLLFAIVSSFHLNAQIDNIFWFAAPDISANHAHNPITFCFTSFSSPASVTISQPANPSFTPVTVNLNPYSYYALDVTSQENIVETAPVNTVCNYGFLITSTANITTYYQLGANNSEIYTLKGRNGLGTDFTIPMQNFLVDGPPSDPRNSIEIVATENNTTVTIIPSQPLTGGIAAGTPITITLNAGQSYCIKSLDQSAAGHLTNTRITSDKPIAVNSTDDSVASNQVSGYSGQDLVGEQLVPDEYAGDFFIAMYNNRLFENISIIPIHDTTHVYINGSATPTVTLNTGQSYTYMPSNSPTIATMITSDKPIHVFQVTGSDGEAGGTQLPALGCTGSQEVVYARPSYSTNMRLSIVVPTNYVNGFTMTAGNNNIPLTANDFTVLPYNTAWSYCYKDFSSSVPTQTVMMIQNSLGPFHLGILDYYSGMSSSLGYFSDYSSIGRIDVFMRDLYCLHDSVSFGYITENIDTVFLITPTGDTLTQEPYIINDLTLADTGLYYLLAHSAIGCEDTWLLDSIRIRLVNSYKPDLGPDQYLCAGEIAVVSANYNTEDVQYYWNTGATSDSIEVITAGEYILNVAVDNEADLPCESADTVLVSFYLMPRADLEADQQSGCTPLTVHFTDISFPSPDSLTTEWIIFDENYNIVNYSSEDNPVITFEDAGVYSVKLKITTPEGCVDSVTKWNFISTSPQPDIDFLASPEVSMIGENGGNVDFTAYLSDNVEENPSNHLTWDFGDGEVTENETSTTHTYSSWGDYVVTLTLLTQGGCGDSVSHSVIIEDDLIFPNVITPNGDGINDVWAIENLNTDINPEDPDEYRHNELRISDRWGKVVFHAKNYDTWAKDGEIHEGTNPFTGNDLNDGVYYYTFSYKGKAKTTEWHGSITIIR
ncbi:MAG: gliding motility-associated C-terminal domain-containing protein [Bacteroidales bacterium]|nr:gliding motility-associated C-terminal domain-containing protein [Bacteroidales bacterium]